MRVGRLVARRQQELAGGLRVGRRGRAASQPRLGRLGPLGEVTTRARTSIVRWSWALGIPNSMTSVPK